MQEFFGSDIISLVIRVLGNRVGPFDNTTHKAISSSDRHKMGIVLSRAADSSALNISYIWKSHATKLM